MAEQFGEKTYEATPHRRQRARKEGHVAKSQDLTSAIILIGALSEILAFTQDKTAAMSNGSSGRGLMVAGVGFEPTTFRL